jgi:hypothetical protein
MRRRIRQAKPEMLGEILESILKKRNIPHTSTDRRLLDLWGRAVGPQIAAQTHPEAVKRGVLFVRVSASVWLHQLQFMKEEILGKVRKLSSPDEVRNIFFSVGEIPASPSGRRQNPETELVPPLILTRDRTMVRESLQAISDPDLREILERVMTREIDRRRRREQQKAPGK